MEKKMYVGIDMGTNSVGLAVTDENYKLYRVKGKDYWCSRTFDKADTAVERRTNRISRRRRQREVARLGILRELFADEIAKVDPGFYARLDESKYHLEDRDSKQPYAVFADKGYTDKEYYAQYPTIFHLRSELIDSDEPHDVRLVYLALANMFKHRGHFLNDSLSSDKPLADTTEAYSNFYYTASELGISFPPEAQPDCVDAVSLESLLGDKGVSRTDKAKNICQYLAIDKKTCKPIYALINLICGLSTKLIDIYGAEFIDEENKKMSIGFRDSSYEEQDAEGRKLLGENYALIDAAKELHDIGLLSSIMKGYKYLSQARVALYKEHADDLKKLKYVLKKYDKASYDKVFRKMDEGSYSAYVGSVNSGAKIRRGVKDGSSEVFCKSMKKILETLPKDDADVQYLLAKATDSSLLPKQLTFENGVIPNQLHAAEMKAILRQAEKYLPFLLEKDEYDLTVSQRIIQLFTFRIPYYVGPIGKNHAGEKGYNIWATRRAGEEIGRVYPWNFEQKIDTKAAAEKFIERMVRHCTYINGERTLPKCSLLYEKFMVLNELNNLRINGEKPSVSVKQDIYTKLFCRGKRVTMKMLKDYIYNSSLIPSKEDVVISGIDNGFNSSLSSVNKFYGILGDAVFADSSQKMIEDIIFWGTVYGNDKKFLKERIEEVYSARLSPDEIKRILGFKFNDWGNLSREFLELEGECECGRCSIIQALWNTNHNLMELLSDQFTFKNELDKKTGSAGKALSDWTIDDLEDKYLSASVKRMIWQTIKMLREVCEVAGRTPDKIFVEMAREDGEKGARTISRKKKLHDLYDAIKHEERELAKAFSAEIDSRTEADFRSKKLYLYYLQQGRCMYSGEIIHFSDLMNDNLYDIDHIYPRHFIKDDSLENNLVLVKKQINNRKQDTFPIERSIQEKMRPFWKSLADSGFISAEKYKRLTRRDEFTDEEKAAFISRQLVETRQGTKAIADILKQALPDTEIVYVKAGLVSDFRQKFELYKVRALNDTHHAKDAYLNIVVGNTYSTKFTKNPLNFIKAGAKHSQDNQYKYNMDKIFDYDVISHGERAWIAGSDGSICTVKNFMSRNTVLITRKAKEVHGALSNKATIWGKNVAKPGAYLPVKSTDLKAQDVTKYGGITSIANSGYTLAEYKVNGKTTRSLEALPVYLGRAEQLTEKTVVDYLSSSLQESSKKKIEDIQVRKLFIPQGSKVKIDGFCYYLGGKTGDSIYLNNAVPLYLSSTSEEYLRKLLKAVENNNYNERDKNGQIILTAPKNVQLLSSIFDKLRSKPFSNNKWNIYFSIVNGKETKVEQLFSKLSIDKQAEVISQIVIWINSSHQNVNLSLIGGSAHSGTQALSKTVSRLNECMLISQSITGIYEHSVDLLTI